MEQMIWLVVLTLAQGILIAFKIIEKRNGKKNNPSSTYHSFPCGDHSNRLVRLETMIKDIKDDIGEIKEKQK